jgi:hypothetical protein
MTFSASAPVTPEVLGTQRVGDLGESLGLQTDQGDPRTAGGRLTGELRPDAAGGSGDENRLTGQGPAGTARHRVSSEIGIGRDCGMN